MNKERNLELDLIPIERVAVPRLETSDKATRKMITQIQTTLLPRFDIELDGSALEYQSMRFVKMQSALDGGKSLRAALRTTDKDVQLTTTLPVDIISGMCLFGASGLTGITVSGRKVSLTDPYELRAGGMEPIVSVKELSSLHASETESILRITKALQLLEQSDRGQSGDMNAVFHLPVPEYKIYMLDLFQNGVIDQAQLDQLNAIIERRANGLLNLVQRRVNVPFMAGSPLDVLNPLLSQPADQVSLGDCTAILAQDPLFAAVMNARPPQSLLDLANLSYSVGYLSMSDNAQAKGGNCLAVEIAEEGPILENAKKLGESIGLPLSMAALYIPPSTVTMSGRNGKQALFMHEPNGSSPLSQLRTVLKNSQERR